MAPEALEGRPATPSSDVWSLGVMLYELASGRRPFVGRTGLELCSAIARDPVPPLPDRVPAPLRAIVARCLSRNPAERYQNASELEAALEVAASAFGCEVPAAPEVQPRAGAVPAGSGKTRWAGLVAGAAVIVAAIALVTWMVDRDGATATYQLVSTFPGAHQSGSLSPDGTSVAFIQADANGVAQVWVKNLSQGEPIQITDGTQPASRPRLAATNDRIVFARRGAGIWTVSPFGGTPRQIVAEGTNADVARDGRTIVFELRDELWVATDGEGEPRQITGFPPRLYSIPYQPAISPDGLRVALFRAELGPHGDIWVVPVAGGAGLQVTHDLREGGTPVWTPDGREIIYSSTRGGSRTLWRIPADGGRAEAVTSGAGDDIEPSLSADGDRLLYTTVRNWWRLHLRDLATAEDRVIREQRDPILWPRFSPDGRTLAFFAPAATSAGHIFVVSREGTDLRQVTDREREVNTMPTWAPDGASLLFYQMLPARALREIPTAGGVSREILPLDWDKAPFGSMRPDGRALVYHVVEPAAAVIRDLETGTERTLPMALRAPRWSPDGRLVAGDVPGTPPPEGLVVTCPADGAPCREITRGRYAAWSAGGRRLYFFRQGQGPQYRELWSVDLATGAERSEGTIGPMRVIDVTFDISSLGQLIWSEFSAGRPELWMVTFPR